MSIALDWTWDSIICGCFHSGEHILQIPLVRGEPGRVIDFLSVKLDSFPKHLYNIKKKKNYSFTWKIGLVFTVLNLEKYFAAIKYLLNF